MKKALSGCRNHRRSYVVTDGDSPGQSGTSNPLPIPCTYEVECHGWSCLESLWDQSSGLKSLKFFSWCISKTCQCLRNIATHYFVPHSFVCHPSAKWYPQWSQVCGGSFGKTMWKAQLFTSSLGLSTVASVRFFQNCLFFPPFVGFLQLPWPCDFPLGRENLISALLLISFDASFPRMIYTLSLFPGGGKKKERKSKRKIPNTLVPG